MRIENYKVSGVEGTYEGSINDQNIPHGSGQIEYKSDGWRYTGEWKDGLPHGRGVSIKPNGECYDGFADRDRMHGNAIFTDVNGVKYSGNFVNNKKEGVFFVTKNKTLTEVIYKDDEEVSRRFIHPNKEIYFSLIDRKEGGFDGGSQKVTINGSMGSYVIKFDLDDPIWSIIQKYQFATNILPKTKAIHSAHLQLVEDKNRSLADGSFANRKWIYQLFFARNQIYYRFFYNQRPIDPVKCMKDYLDLDSSDKKNNLNLVFNMPLCAGLRGNPFSNHWYLSYPDNSPLSDVVTYLAYLERKKASEIRKISLAQSELKRLSEVEADFIGRLHSNDVVNS